MAQIEIIDNQYNTTCDTYGCGNIGTMIVGEPNQNIGQRVIMCPECLQNIINAAPIDMILNRPELAEVEEDEFVPEDSNGKLDKNTHCISNPEYEKLEAVGKALEGDESEFDILSFSDLKSLAVAKGLAFKVGMSKVDLINYLTE